MKSDSLQDLYALAASPVLTLPDLLDAILEAAIQTTPADVGGAIFVPEPGTGRLFWSLKVVEGTPTRPLRKLATDWGEKESRIPAASLGGFLTPGANGTQENPAALFHESRSRISVPLLERQALCGRLQVEARSADGLDHEDLQSLAELAQGASRLIWRLLLRRHAAVRGLDIQFVGSSPVLLEMEDQIQRLAADPVSPVLIRGERGSGKELAAYALHFFSCRREGPFVPANSAAFLSTLALDELFGHSRGAFTGAESQREGLFQQAQGGSLFLDEIGDLPLEIQGVLLRTLDQRTIRKIGCDQTVVTDVRVLAATNKNLEAMVEEGSFRSDLYDRLNVLQVHVPPLRARQEDIPQLANYFLRKTCADNGRLDRFQADRACRTCLQLGGRTCAHPDLYTALQELDFPGNVRELRNLMVRLSTTFRDEELRPKHLECFKKHSGVNGARTNGSSDRLNGSFNASSNGSSNVGPPDLRLDAAIARHIESVLEQTEGNKTQAARLLGLPLTTLINKMKRLGMS